MDSEFFTCADQVFLGFDCIDPNAAIPPCLVEDTDHPQCRLDLSSNGKCDLENNDEVCGGSPSLINCKWIYGLKLVPSRHGTQFVLVAFRGSYGGVQYRALRLDALPEFSKRN